jgi:hypothetical protein
MTGVNIPDPETTADEPQIAARRRRYDPNSPPGANGLTTGFFISTEPDPNK